MVKPGRTSRSLFALSRCEDSARSRRSCHCAVIGVRLVMVCKRAIWGIRQQYLRTSGAAPLTMRKCAGITALIQYASRFNEAALLSVFGSLHPRIGHTLFLARVA